LHKQNKEFLLTMTCGYVCPNCEGKGFTENLEPCVYCNAPELKKHTEDNANTNKEI